MAVVIKLLELPFILSQDGCGSRELSHFQKYSSRLLWLRPAKY